MRIQLILLFCVFSLEAFSVDDKSMKDLFKKYDSVVDDKKIDLIDEIFTAKYIKDAGGKKELIGKIKGISGPKTTSDVTWQKGHKANIFFAKVKFIGSKTPEVSTFRVIDVNGKPKIDGTENDAD